MTLEEVSAFTGLSVEQILKLKASGKLKSRTDNGGGIDISMLDIETFISEGSPVAGANYTTPGGVRYGLIFTVNRPSTVSQISSVTAEEVSAEQPSTLRVRALLDGVSQYENELGFTTGTALTDLVKSKRFKVWRAMVKSQLDKL